MDKIPAIEYLREKGIPFDIKTFPEDTEKGSLSIARVLGVDPRTVVKTLVLKGSSKKFYICLTGGDSTLDFDLLKRATGERDIAMASPKEILEQTGFRVGAIPPFAIKNELPVFIDETLAQCETLYVGAGRFGNEILLSPDNLLKATNGVFAGIVR
jgi:Cys-tRNA(Pro)/Cys-tRNA(Cys) deacylase